MKIPNQARRGVILLGALLIGCGSDDSTGGGTIGASGANGGGAPGSGGNGGIIDLEPGGSNIHQPITGGASGASGSTGSGDASIAGSSDAGRNPDASVLDATQSPECDALCMKGETMCMATKCNRTFWCRPRASGECVAATRAYLQCVIDTGQWSCTIGSWSIGSKCAPDITMCM